MNTAFRDVIFINDLTMFRSWLIALGIAIIGSNFIEDLGFLGDDGLRRQVFSPIAAMVGGYLFGVGIVIAGGCGSGVLYKQGEGQFAALVATFGFAVSLIATLHGPLQPIMKAIKSYRVSIGTGEDAITTPALWDFFGQSLTTKWAVIAIVIAIIIPIVLKGRPFAAGAKKGWSWSVGGAVIGL
ncbi:MAG: YeeE/YedE family protein, partial [Bacteroidetes bacterium]|nr:YeeE/YedE family protein [Bacteroidota bacterium]